MNNNLDETKYIKKKLVIFLMFFIVICVYEVLMINSIFDSISPIDFVDDVNIDGSDFSPIVNFFIGTTISILFFLILCAGFFESAFLGAIPTLIFMIFYVRNLPADKEKFFKYIRLMIWGSSLITLIVCCILVTFKSVFFILLVFIPMPIFVNLISILRLKGKYKRNFEKEHENNYITLKE